MLAQLNNPETIEMMHRMMSSMDPEALAGAMKQSGLDVTPEQAAKMKEQARTPR